MFALLSQLYRARIPFVLFVLCTFAQLSAACTKEPTLPVSQVRPVLQCKPQHAVSSVAHDKAIAETTVAGALSASVSVTPTGEANLSIRLIAVPGRAGIEPGLSVVYSSAGGDGPLGVASSGIGDFCYG